MVLAIVLMMAGGWRPYTLHGRAYPPHRRGPRSAFTVTYPGQAHGAEPAGQGFSCT